MSEGADSSQDLDGSPWRDRDSRTGTPTQDRNPEPPKELLEGHLIDADNIGDTVFSKHWMFTTLMDLIKAVDSESVPEEGATVTEAGLDLNENIQDELCKLWDMSMNSEVVSFLMEFKAVEIFTGIIAKSKSPRATEICVGLLGNMACDNKACEGITESEKLRELLLLLLESPDAPTLVETTRLLHTCVSNPAAYTTWLACIKEAPDFIDDITFILKSSTNNDLLRNTAELIDKLMDLDEGLCEAWSSETMVEAALEAIAQNSDNSNQGDALATYIHILQLLSTCEPGVLALSHHSERLCRVMVNYLKNVCADEIVSVEGREDAIGSTLSVLKVTFSAWSDASVLLTKDFHMLRCLLKILHVVYPILHRVERHKSVSPGSRHRSMSLGGPLADGGERDGAGVPCVRDGAGVPRVAEDCHPADVNHHRRSGEPRGPGDPQRGPTTLADGDGDAERDGRTKELLGVIYEGLQSLLQRALCALHREHVKLSANGRPSPRVPSPGNASAAADVQRETVFSKSLDYLDSMCERERIQFMLHAVDQAPDTRDLLLDMAQHWSLERLARIVRETPGNHSHCAEEKS